VGALQRALEPKDVAIVLTEPVLTNNVVLLRPESGFHEALRAACTATGTVLAYDETHSHVLGEGGCVGAWGLEPDVLTIGKAVAGGVPLGAYGLSAVLADELEIRPGRTPIATGGTLFGNPLSMAAARATLEEVLVPEAYEHATALGARLADGIESAVRDAGLPWTTHRFGPRSGSTFAAEAPRNAIEAWAAADRMLTRALRLGLANRGVWEALPGAGPTMSVSATEADVDRYVGAYAELLAGVA
jgi:glutamate-1-semialdehyde 2,1-aminomutase